MCTAHDKLGKSQRFPMTKHGVTGRGGGGGEQYGQGCCRGLVCKGQKKGLQHAQHVPWGTSLYFSVPSFLNCKTEAVTAPPCLVVLRVDQGASGRALCLRMPICFV